MNDPYKIEFPLFTATLDEDNQWIYKANTTNIKKKDGTLKKKYKDLPRIKVIYEIEDKLNKRYKNMLDSSMKEINAKLIEITRAKR